ncbi:MAG: Hsp20/alpha crystallin family protein [Gammaproteobacteria bacterium]|nr:Hsp20/alpha crystallin family protein [Gammaproteobacteria bacterium]MCY4278146.1 Hsp20/alpha crystallin family protein [Gammaproteobacteria bacterium]
MLYPASTFFRRDPFSLVRRFGGDFASAARGYPSVNLWHSQDRVAIRAEVPGVDPADIDISVKDNVLVFSGERKTQTTPEKAVWHKRERNFGKFSRAVRIPFNLDPDKTEARVRNGVLEVVVHRREEDKPRRIEVKAA